MVSGRMHRDLAVLAVLAVTLSMILGLAANDPALTATSLTVALGGGVGWMMAGRLARQRG